MIRIGVVRGLEQVMRLAESCDLHGIVRERLHVPTDKGANAAGKVATIVAGMVTGPIRSTISMWSAAAAWGNCAAGCTRPRRWDRSCARSAMATSVASGHFARVPGSVGVAHAAAARRVRSRSSTWTVAAPHVWQGEAGRGLRTCDSRRIPGAATRLQPLGGNHKHRGRATGHRREPTTRRQRRIDPRRRVSGR